MSVHPEPDGGFVIRVPGPIHGKQRARTGRGRHYTPEQTKNREALIRLSAQNQHPGIQPDDGSAEWGLSITFRRHTRAHAADLDNLIKAVADALNGWAYKDDRQVTRVDACVVTDRERAPLTIIHLYPR